MKNAHRKSRYAVHARFTKNVPAYIVQLVNENAVYLGKRGQWCSRAKALRFASREAAELAINDKWHRLRVDGSRSVILSVVEAHDE